MTRKFLTGAAMVLALALTVPAAMAQNGPKPSSENNWPGISTVAPQSATVQPHYVWQEGYDAHGKWRGHWHLVP